MSTEWHPALWILQVLGYWQTLLAGLLAVGAAAFTIWATVRSADREVDAANKMSAIAQKQIDITLRLDRLRVLNETCAFLIALEAAAGIVRDNARAASTMVAQAPGSTYTLLAYNGRQRVSCPMFPDLRPACVRLGGDLTPLFLKLDQEIAVFTADWIPGSSPSGMAFRNGATAGFHEGLAKIKAQARQLQQVALQHREQCDRDIRATLG